MNVNSRNQTLVEMVKGVDAGYHNSHQVVDVTTHAVELHDFGELGDSIGKLGEPCGVVLVGADGDKHIDAEVEAVAAKQSNFRLDDVFVFKSSDTAPARGGAQVDFLGDLAG